MGDPPLADPLGEVVSRSGIPFPNGVPYTHITAAMVVWNEEARLKTLLYRLRPFFASIAVIVQKSDDRTLEIAQRLADIVEVDSHRGFGDASFGPYLLPKIKTPWTFKVDGDEMPDEDLLESLSSATWYAEHHGLDGIWVSFHSAVDGIEYTEQHGHLRLFKTHLGWPGTQHSRPPTENTAFWRHGHVRHDRSLDEMMQDYIRYWHLGQDSQSWKDHNRLMMRSACNGTAAVKGWEYVQAFAWWPEIEAIAYEGEDRPWLPASPASPPPQRRSRVPAEST